MLSVANFSGSRPAPSIAESRWAWEIQNQAAGRASLYLRGVIGVSQAYNDYGGEFAGTFRELEDAINDLGDVSEVDLYIYSPGGYVYPAQALHNVISRHSARWNGIVDGLAASAATIVLMACDTIRIPSNAQLMIHNAATWAEGDYREMERTARSLRRENRNVANLYADRIANATGRDRADVFDEVNRMMDEETWMTGAEALELGLADETGEPIDLADSTARAQEMIGPINLAPLPDEVRRLFDTGATANIGGPSPANIGGVSPATENPPITTMSTPATDPAPAPTEPVNEISPAPAAPVAEPVPAAPVASAAPVVEPAPVAAAPVAPVAALPDIATVIANATREALAPITERLDQIENRVASGATSVFTDPAAGSGAPTASAVEPTDFGTVDKSNYRQLMALGLKAAREGNGQPSAANV